MKQQDNDPRTHQPGHRPAIQRREFLKSVGLGTALLTQQDLLFSDESNETAAASSSSLPTTGGWPVLKYYDQITCADRDADWWHWHRDRFVGRAGRPARLGDHESSGQGVCADGAGGAVRCPLPANAGWQNVGAGNRRAAEPGRVRGEPRQPGTQPRPAPIS